MNALKAQWVVTAGLIPGQPMDEYEKAFVYTSQMYEEDRHNPVMAYYELLNKAHYDAKEISNPGMVNCVNVSFVWI